MGMGGENGHTRINRSLEIGGRKGGRERGRE